MNIGSMVPIGLAVSTMPVDRTPDATMLFHDLMPATEGVDTRAVAPAAAAVASNAVAAPTVLAVAAPIAASFSLPVDDIGCEPATLPMMPQIQQLPAPPSLPEPAKPSPPEAETVQFIVQPLRTMIAQQTRVAKGVTTSSVMADKVVETEEDEPADAPAIETLAASPPKTELPVVNQPTLGGFPVDAKITNVAIERDPENIAVVELQPRTVLSEKPGIWNMPTAAAVQISPPASFTQPAAPAGFVATGHLDLARDTLWLDQLAREIVAVGSNDGKLRFGLTPKALGSLDVAIITQTDGVQIQLHPTTENAARIFAAEQPKLAEELRQSGVRLVNSDMMGGQQAGNMRDQSHTQSANRHAPIRVSANPTFATTSHPATNPPRRGRYA